MKFTSKTMHTLTKNASGKDLIDIQSAFSKKGYATTMIKIEKDILWERRRNMVMTCSSCAKLKNNSVDGFCDREFDRLRQERKCLECLKSDWHALEWRPEQESVQGMAITCCNLCIEVTLVSEMGPAYIPGFFFLHWGKHRICRREACEKKAKEIQPWKFGI